MSLIRRALTGAFATVVVAGGLVAGATRAAATTSAFCDYAGSTRLFTANDGDYKVWLDSAPASNGYLEYHLCFGAGSIVRGDLVVTEPLSGALVPNVSVDLDDQDCPRLFEVQDPVQLITRLWVDGSDNPSYVCFGVGDQAYRITFTTSSPEASPNVVLFLDRHTELGWTYCQAFSWQCSYADGSARIELY